jgi:peptidyl-dipeptidase Dcp
MAGTSLYPDVAENCMSTSFSHIFQGGYSSDIIYKWAEVLDADALLISRKGIFNSPTKFKITFFKSNRITNGIIQTF